MFNKIGWFVLGDRFTLFFFKLLGLSYLLVDYLPFDVTRSLAEKNLCKVGNLNRFQSKY